ncbi:ABC transporter substrate-binding protein [Novosphingobium album (ex Hu et al. 2023)]|uniref:ABC transporter substrate-binding protein n=1 Tax=Novosphingobium album (ex Hu et al. 2023) TaxID=2930093 RepID=A0ABT0AXS4_9SPHN|nr:ABC transporter substrate-binding protein [Novosphingobium album (ex Hu et al. 2023)]MCJ2177604.1 ABC transporter substrate-binding protein [Novosphingobium album (ex Hu et al. 2023)]
MTQSIKVGVLNDMADIADLKDGDPGPGDVTGWLEREIEAVRKSGRLSAPVEFVHAYGLGLPSGTAEAVERAYRQLADAGVGLIVGPAIGDNALVATPLAEELRIPTINWAGAERARGRYMFHHQVGSHEDESLVMARHMAALGCRRLGVVYDISPIGTRHLKYLQDEANILGIAIVATEGISPLADDASEEAGKVLPAQPDGFVYLGLGLSAPGVAAALTGAEWKGPRIMNTAGLRGYHGSFAKACDGWFYIDMHSDSNRTLQAVMAELSAPRQQALAIAKGHDIGRLVAEGLARAKDFSREGVRVGLEQIKWLPAAEGEEGTLLGFGIQDRGALHGRYLVVRQWMNGETVEVTSQP